MLFLRLLGAALLTVLSGSFLYGQQMVVAKVVFKDPGPFRQADLEEVAAVHPGQKMLLKDIQAAAQRLADTGCFDDVRVDSNGSPSALTLVFLLKPSVSGDLHEVVFDNFVWMTPEELQAAVHASAPLFGGGSRLPETGGVLDAVNAALVAALATKGVTGADVGHEVQLASSARPETVVHFRVNQPAVLVGTIALQGSGPEFAASRATALKLHQTRYLAGTGPGSTTDLLLRPYEAAGYLDAHLTDEKISVSPVSGGSAAVDLKATVEGGAAYRVGTLSFAGTPVVSAEVFAAGAKLHPGDVASRQRLLESEQPVDTAYHKLGYMDEYVDAVPTRDEAAHTVSYALKVVPGEVYHVHTTTVEGLPPAAKAQFDAAWQLRPGALYDADYIKAFLTNNTGAQALSGYVGSYQAAADPSTHLVDVAVKFQPVGSAKLPVNR